MFADEPNFSKETEERLRTLAEWIETAASVVWFTGAGISTESGLPDFRGPDGAWTRRDQGLPPPIPSKRLSEIVPNPAHRAVVEFEKMGKCDFLISQNVDNLHIQSGYPIHKLAELHGNKDRLRCSQCQRTHAIVDLVSMPRRKKSRKNPTESYECPDCGGTLARSIVNFGDKLPKADLDDSFQWAKQADLLIVVGSSCEVVPASDIPVATKTAGGKVAVLNIGQTGIDDIADVRINNEKVGQLLPALLARITA
jgi:NAD-dependent SIR2 family protein deacetylase